MYDEGIASGWLKLNIYAMIADDIIEGMFDYAVSVWREGDWHTVNSDFGHFVASIWRHDNLLVFLPEHFVVCNGNFTLVCVVAGGGGDDLGEINKANASSNVATSPTIFHGTSIHICSKTRLWIICCRASAHNSRVVTVISITNLNPSVLHQVDFAVRNAIYERNALVIY